MTRIKSSVLTLFAVVAVASACRTGAPMVRFAPSGTDLAKLRAEFPLSDADYDLSIP